MTEAEIKAKKAEYMRKYRAEHKEEVSIQRKTYREAHKEEINAKRRAARERKKAESNERVQEELEEIAAVPEFAETIEATKINQKYRLSFICGSTRRGNRVFIIEKLASGDSPNRYRLKELTLRNFPTLAAAKTYCEGRGIKFLVLSDLSQENNPWS